MSLVNGKNISLLAAVLKNNQLVTNISIKANVLNDSFNQQCNAIERNIDTNLVCSVQSWSKYCRQDEKISK